MEIKLEKPDEFQTVFKKMAGEVKKHNIKFEGDETKGNGSGYGFAGRYAVYDDHIMLTVSKKPFFISESKVKSEVMKYWSQVCARAKQTSVQG